MTTTRSPNYPAVSLPEAVDMVGKLYQREKRSPADPERVALALGYRSMSGPARTKLSALRKFGLVEDTGNGVRISDLGLTILYPESTDEKRSALRVAATLPPLFRELAGYPGASDENLVSRLIRIGFTEPGAKLAVASFRETMSLAPDEESGYSGRDEGPAEVLAAPADRSGRVASNLPPNANALSIPLPGGLTGELRWVGGAMTKQALAHMRKWLDLYEETISASEASETAGVSPSDEREPSGPLLLSERSRSAGQD